APGQPGVEQADGRDGEAVDLEAEHAGVPAGVGVERDEAAAGDGPRVDGEAEPVRRLEGEREGDRAEVGLVEPERARDPDALERGGDGADLAADVQGGFERQGTGRRRAAREAEGEVQGVEGDGPQLEVEGDGDIEAAAALEVEAAPRRVADH